MADRIGVINRGELIVVEDKQVLMRTLGKKQLTISLAHALAQIPPAMASAALELSTDGLTLTYSFDTQQEETGIAGLLRKLGDNSIEFKDLRTNESSLEDIFVSLVHHPKEVNA